MESLMHAYDLAQDREQAHGWLQFCGAHLGVSSEGDGQVYVWDTQDPTDCDEMFDAEEYDNPDEFLSAVQDWVHEEISVTNPEVSA